MPVHARPRPIICHSHAKNQFHATVHLWDIGLPEILQSGRLRAGQVITQEVEIYQTYNLGWETKYHNNSPFKLLLGKSNDKIFKKKKKMLYFGALFAEVRAKTNSLRKLESVSFKISNFMNRTPKNPKKNNNKRPHKNLIDSSLEKCWSDQLKKWEVQRQQWFHRAICLWGLIHKRILTISYLLDILLIILKYFGYFQPCQTKLNGFATLITHSWDIAL